MFPRPSPLFALLFTSLALSALAQTPPGLLPGGMIPNFRLIDHRGLSRELFYESTAKVVVVVFTKSGSPRALQTATALRALRARFPAGDVVIWQIDSDPTANRDAIAAEQTLFNNETPVLLDDAQLVATELGATRELETFVMAAPPFTDLIYRGPLDNADPASGASPTEHYALDAVAAALAGRPPARPSIDMRAGAAALALAPAPAIDYALNVAPIVARRCVECHSPGNIAPFTFQNHAELSTQAASIRAALLGKRMSPWHADPQHGVFSNNVALTPAEASTLHAWVRAATPRGTGTDPLTRAAAPAGDWPLGQPDLVVTIPSQSIPATGTIEYRYITVPVPVTTDRWLRAAVVRPGNARVVHHALVFEGTLLDVLAAGGGLGGFYAGYVPGMQQTFFPEGTGKRVRQGGQVTFQMHYTAAGQPETDQTQIGFYFAAGAPARELLTKAAANTDISIPPGAKDYERTASFVPSATRDVLLYELNPHMHYRGKRMKFEALYRDGTSEVLLNVPHYDFHWQSQYRLAHPKRLPAGTTIRLTGAFDNSAQNRDNPNPNATVRFGEQTNDEMFIGYVNYAELESGSGGAAPRAPARVGARGRVARSLAIDLNAHVANPPATFSIPGPLPAGLVADTANGRITGTPGTAGRFAIPVTLTNAAGSTATVVDLVIDPPASVPEFIEQPKHTRARIGETVTLRVSVVGATSSPHDWFFRGAPLRSTAVPELTLSNVTAANAGDYHCVVVGSSAVARSATATLSVDVTALVNLSARASVGTGANVVIPGITVRGTQPKTLLIRAAGPALTSFGVGGALADPVMSIFTAAGEKVLANDNWGQVPDVTALRNAAAAQGAFALPAGSRDAAMLVTLPPGGYTVQVAGNGTGSAALGVAIVEVYEADANPGTLTNLSCRAQVGTGGDILIAGFAITGSREKRVLVRAVGPALAELGVSGTLANPQLEIIRQGEAAVLQRNDDWDAALAPTFASVGAFALPAGSRDAALVVTLAPGSYTAQVSGVGNTTGVAIVEVYELP